MNDKEIIKRVDSVKLCLMAHPDNEPDSEFMDRINDLIDIRNELSERQTITEPDNNPDTKQLIIGDVSGSAFVIMFQKKPLKNILFKSVKEARNYIKMQYHKRTFKEPTENVFVCNRYGTTFEITQLHYR